MKKQILLISLLMVALISCNAQNKTDEKKTIKASEIIEKIDKGENVYYQNRTIEGNLDFTTVKNSNLEALTIKRAFVNASITFVNCEFKGKVISSKAIEPNTIITAFDKNLTFIKCSFMDEVNFNEAIIEGATNFSECVFEKKAIFEGIQCKNKNNFFTQIKFKDASSFQGSVFSGDVNFLNAEFFGNTSFQQSIFIGNFQISNAKFYGYADFTNCLFNSGIITNYTEFEKVAFSSSIIHQRADFMYVKFNNFCEFDNINFNAKTRFNESTFNNSFNIENSVFTSGKPDLSKIVKGDKYQLKMNKTINYQGNTLNTNEL